MQKAKDKKEMDEWRIEQRSQKLKTALQRKKMKDAEDDAKREKKWKEYNVKAEEIKKKLQDRFYGTGGNGGHGIGYTAE